MQLTPELLLHAYAHGFFPMAESAEADIIGWYDPEMRGIIPLESFHTPKNLAKLWRQQVFNIRTDTAFRAVMQGCADRESTWINSEIIDTYSTLHRLGYAHSIECWQEEKLVGGLYGIALGGAFFGESMFSIVPNASKVALVALVERLNRLGYVLLDTQYVNAHLLQFGCTEISRAEYHASLQKALEVMPLVWC